MRFVLGGLLIAAGVIGAVAFMLGRFGALEERVDAFARAELPAQAVQLEAREYTVYLDLPSGTDSGWTLSIRDPDNRPVPLLATSGRVRYSVGGRSGHRIGRVELTRAGRYSVTGTAVPGARVLFGGGLGGSIVGMVLGTLAIAFTGIGLGLAIVIRAAAVRRRRA